VKFSEKNLFERITIAATGIWAAFFEEKNFRIQLVCAAIVAVAMVLLRLDRIEASILLLTMFSVLALELINSQIERFLDIIQPELHAKVKRIKDFSAGAVLISVVGSVIIGVIILLPHLLAL